MYFVYYYCIFVYLSVWSAYKGNAKIWWKFAIQSILETEVKRRKNNWSWDHMLNHRNLCRSYSDSYRSKLVSKKVSNELQKTCDFHEESLDLFNLLLIRQRVELEVRFHHFVISSFCPKWTKRLIYFLLRKVERSGKLQKQEQEKSSWFGGWWGSKKEDDAGQDKDICKYY